MRGPRKERYGMWLTASLLVAFLLSVEIFFGSWFKAPGLWNLGILRSVDWTIDATPFYDHDGPIRYRRDYYGLRGGFGQPGNIDLLVIGNSTTDQRNVSEGETWTDRLGACLKSRGLSADAANAGVTGQTLKGLANNFDLWFGHIPGLKPKWVLAYFGVTEIDLAEREESDDVRRYHETSQAPSRWQIFSNWLKMNSALNRLVSDAKANFKAWRRGETPGAAQAATGGGQNGARSLDAQLAAALAQAVDIDSSDFKSQKARQEAEMKAELAAFQSRLERLADRIEAFGAKPVFVTQNSAAYRVRQGKLWGNAALYIRLRVLAERTMAFCQDRGIACVDLSADMFLEDGDAYDPSHLTAKGSARIADYLCPRLAPLLAP